jgi:hypothetical protein
MASQSSAEKVRRYRQRQRERGLRCIQMWVPDVTSPEFGAEAHRQSLLVNASDQAEEDQAFIDAISDWGPDAARE